MLSRGNVAKTSQDWGGWGNRERLPRGWVVTIPLWGKSSPNMVHRTDLLEHWN